MCSIILWSIYLYSDTDSDSEEDEVAEEEEEEVAEEEISEEENLPRRVPPAVKAGPSRQPLSPLKGYENNSKKIR